ncbi:hypothetical protein JKA73_00375 [Myxococcus xanthus]|nr:hypothetical protein JKA73_00375 [Myxococcus xanthus]
MANRRSGVAFACGWRWSVALLTAVVGCGAPELPADPPPPAAEQETLRAAEEQAALLSPPAGCTEITMGELTNGIERTPVQYGSQPTYVGSFSDLGDPAVADVARIRLDVNTAPGVYDLATGGTNLFTCEQCVWGVQDSGTSTAKTFVAESGTLLLALKVTPQQTIGALANVTLRQSVAATPLYAPYTGTEPVAGGECRWIRFATWNTARNGGCDPREGSLTANIPGHTCVATNRAADDGTLERSLGTKTHGEACTYTAPTSEYELAATDCAEGYACTTAWGSSSTCMATCDFMAADPGCPTGTVCGVQGLCQEQAVQVASGFDFDPALIGEECTLGYAEFCGAEGARGVCLDLNGTGRGTCFPYTRARSDCGPGEELGYVSYPLAGGGYDRTYGFCYPDGL